jgi:hypothetical protein
MDNKSGISTGALLVSAAIGAGYASGNPIATGIVYVAIQLGCWFVIICMWS